MNKIKLANLPTPIEKMQATSDRVGKNIYIKRDDYTGMEISGNKIRKLEYVLADAKEQGADVIITTGGVQSNHCRATAAVCARLGLDCHLVLKEKEGYEVEGNLFLDYLFGATVHLIPSDGDREEEMGKVKAHLEGQGRKPYSIPVGASNAVGSLGYKEAYQEILDQETQMATSFDTIVLAVGSGGTYAGLWYENLVQGQDKRILGFSMDASSEKFTADITDIVQNMDDSVDDFSTIKINDSYVGAGYSISQPEEIHFYVDVAQEEGILFDPCYTGKAFRGLVQEIEKGALADSENILFIHTGGLFDWTQEDRETALNYAKRIK